MTPATEIWTRFREISTVRFKSKSHTGIGWSGAGSGLVQVTEPTPNVLHFNESGSWRQEGGKEIRFNNVFRWTQVEEQLRLEHLRFGVGNPVFIFAMSVDKDGVWRETSPHPCRDDCYRASMRVEAAQIFVSWLVRGPKRDEIIDYIYL